MTGNKKIHNHFPVRLSTKPLLSEFRGYHVNAMRYANLLLLITLPDIHIY